MKKSMMRWRFHRALVNRMHWLPPFSRSSSVKRCLIISERDQIAQAQLFPFFHYDRELQREYQVQFRELPMDRFLQGNHPYRVPVDAVCFQTWFTLSPAEMLQLVEKIRDTWPAAYLAYFDWFAPTDLRYAEVLDPHIDAYLKKHVLRDVSQYGRPTIGDTNLTDFAARQFSLKLPESCFSIPSGFFQEKLFLGPNFALAPNISPYFAGEFPAGGERPIDVHARVAAHGREWYEKMRQMAMHKAMDLSSRHTVAHEGRVSCKAYLRELRQSKICLSPFGYGEVCWRDFEAIMMGSLLFKPDASHVNCQPDIFRAGETYVPLQWDLRDLAEKVEYYLTHEDERLAIAERAYALVKSYLVNNDFLDEVRPLLTRLGLGAPPNDYAPYTASDNHACR